MTDFIENNWYYLKDQLVYQQDGAHPHYVLPVRQCWNLRIGGLGEQVAWNDLRDHQIYGSLIFCDSLKVWNFFHSIHFSSRLSQHIVNQCPNYLRNVTKCAWTFPTKFVLLYGDWRSFALFWSVHLYILFNLEWEWWKTINTEYSVNKVSIISWIWTQSSTTHTEIQIACNQVA